MNTSFAQPDRYSHKHRRREMRTNDAPPLSRFSHDAFQPSGTPIRPDTHPLSPITTSSTRTPSVTKSTTSRDTPQHFNYKVHTHAAPPHTPTYDFHPPPGVYPGLTLPPHYSCLQPPPLDSLFSPPPLVPPSIAVSAVKTLGRHEPLLSASTPATCPLLPARRIASVSQLPVRGGARVHRD